LVYQPGDVFLAVLPLFHGFGQTTMMNAPFLAQSTVVLCPRFDAHQVSRAIASEGVTIAAFVPTMFQLLLAGDKHGAFDFSSVRAAVSGGAAMPVALAQQFTERYGVTVLEGYGLTETSPVLSFNRPEDHRLGSLGKPIRDCEVAIMRPDGSFASPGETGEIVARGDFVMKGYHGQPEETAKATQGGWFHTRDLGYFDEEGYLHFAGLIKDLVITSGMNVSPAEVEKVLLDHPAVAAAAVIGASDTLRGEIVTAFAVLHAEAEVTEKELNAYCREQLAPYKKPRRWIFVEALPRDASGRVDKQALRMALAAGADEAAR